MASPISSSNEKRRVLRHNSRHQTHELNSEITENGSTKARFAGPENVDSANVSIPAQNDGNVLPKLGKLDVNNEVAKSASKSPHKQKKVLPKLEGRRYSLRSSLGSGRVLRSMSEMKCNTQSEPVNTPVNPVTKGKKKEVNVSSLAEHDEFFLLKSGKVDVNEVAKSASKSPCKRKKVPSELKGRRYPLRSSLGTGRVLRSMSETKCKTQPEPVNTSVNPVTKGRKKRRKVKRASNDEFSVTRKRVRYLLTRMNYEQNLIDAYSGEGWKGQSAEKLRPEKELERAKSEILRCKFKIRELFRHLDSLSSEGRFEESLFDSKGQIDSEDIFCAKCGSKDLSANNDIILCDGICDRGFHQKCLNPPLLSEDIPLGDEGWLCPACDCKVDCIELLNEFQGSKISIKDTWEKVFPEAVTIANGDKQYDDLPSDDSEDYDYHPDGPEIDVEDHKEESHSEESNSEESDFTSASEDSDASNSTKQNENFGFPSDDSEDDDFDPDAPDINKSILKDGSSSDESDFTSDSDEFCIELSKTLGANEDSASSFQNRKPIAQSGEGTSAGERNNSELFSMSEPGFNQENTLATGKRQLERLDYKKLYDEAYGKSSSDSSDDEDWSEAADKSTPNRGKKYVKRKESDGPLKENAQAVKNHKNSKIVVGMSTEVDSVMKAEHEVAEQHHGCHEPGSYRDKSPASSYKRLGEIAKQKLYESFQENQYPTREKKESLAQELGLTYRQVDKWFTNSRHQYRISAVESHPNGFPSPNKDNSAIYGKTTGGGNNPDDSIILSSASNNGLPSPNKDNNAINGKTTGYGNNPDDSIILSSVSKGVKRKKSILAQQPKVGAEHGREDGGIINEIDEERQKAIARELRKMKQRR